MRGEGAVKAGSLPFALARRLQRELRLLQLAVRVGQLAPERGQLPFQFAQRRLLGDRLQAALEQLDERLGEAEAACVGVGLQALLERLGEAGVDDRSHC